MKALLLTHKGSEAALAQEVKELLNMQAEVKEEHISIPLNNLDQAAQLLIFSQITERLLLVDDLKNWLSPGMSFAVRASSMDEERKIGAEINAKNEFKVDLKNPEITIYVYDNCNCIDLSDDISKRSFRIFTHKQSMKGTAAAALLREASYSGEESLLDPFPKDGTIVLEAAHQATKRAVRFYDLEDIPLFKLKPELLPKDIQKQEIKQKNTIFAASHDWRDISAIKKNAKIAGVNKSLSISHTEMDWLDTKFAEEQVDLLVSYPPNMSAKQWKDFCYKAVYIAKKIVLLVPPETKIENEYLKIVKEKPFFLGKAEKKIIWLEKHNQQ